MTFVINHLTFIYIQVNVAILRAIFSRNLKLSLTSTYIIMEWQSILILKGRFTMWYFWGKALKYWALKREHKWRQSKYYFTFPWSPFRYYSWKILSSKLWFATSQLIKITYFQEYPRLGQFTFSWVNNSQDSNGDIIRGDEWSLRAFASMPSSEIFLRAWADIKNLLCKLASNAKIWGARASKHSFKFCKQIEQR